MRTTSSPRGLSGECRRSAELASPLLRDGGLLVAWKGAATPRRRPSSSAPPSGWRWNRSASSPSANGPVQASPPARRSQKRPPHQRVCRAVRAWRRSARSGGNVGVDGRRLRDLEPEGRRRQDDHRGQPRRVCRRRRAARCCSSTSIQQCNATVALGLDRDLSPSSYECLTGETSVAVAARPAGPDNLWIVPANRDLAGASVELPRIDGYERPPARRARPGPRALRDDRCSTARHRSGRSP